MKDPGHASACAEGQRPAAPGDGWFHEKIPPFAWEDMLCTRTGHFLPSNVLLDQKQFFSHIFKSS
jgi:hypothetical protein